MSSNKKTFLRNIFTTNLGCGKQNLPDIFQPKPKTKIPSNINTNYQKPTHYPSSSTSWDTGEDDHEDYTPTTFSLNTNSPLSCLPESSRKLGDTVAIVKDSDDPYGDFRRSMLEMILEREIYSKDGLVELLKCYLELNCPIHHGMIIQAFMEIWNGGVGTTRSVT